MDLSKRFLLFAIRLKRQAPLSLDRFFCTAAMGWGKGKGKRSVRDTSKAVWIGGVPEGTEYAELLALGQQAGDAKWAEVRKGGTGFIGYSSAEEAANAAEELNGAMLGSSSIEADTWTKKTPAAGAKKWTPPGKKWTPPAVKWTPPTAVTKWSPKQPQYQKKGKGQSKGKSKKGLVRDTSKALWVGDIPEGTTYQELLEVARQVCDAKWADVKKGTGAIGFASAEEATAALSALEGSVVGGSVITVDAWEGKK